MEIDARQLPLGFLLNTLGRRVREETEKALAGWTIGVVDLGILWLLALQPGRPQADYARYQKLDLTTFGRHVDHLEKQGFLVRRPLEHDRRAKSLTLTKSGQQALEKGRRKINDVEARIVARVPGVSAPLKKLLTKLLQTID
jgi:DNA-binding MarR family transcriptional regulator